MTRTTPSRTVRKVLLLTVLTAFLLLILFASVTAAEEDVVVDIEEVATVSVDADGTFSVAEAAVETPIKVDEAELTEEEAQKVVEQAEEDVTVEAPIDMDEDELTEEEAQKIVEETEANAARLAEEARAHSSIREPRTYDGISAIHYAAKVHPEGCAAVTHEYLDFMGTHVAEANRKVRRARADVNEAKSHALHKLNKAEAALQKAEEDADKTVLTALKTYGGDMQKTCVEEIQSSLEDQLERAYQSGSNFIATWMRQFSILQGSVMMMMRTGEGVVAHLIDAWYPTYEAAWDFVYLYTEKSLTSFNAARTAAANKGEDHDMFTYLSLYARGFGYALVPVMTSAVGIWVVLIFWPLLLVGVFGPAFFYQVWWRVFIVWNMYGLTFPTGYFKALGEYKSLLVNKQYADAAGRAADAFFDSIGDDAEESFYNGIVAVFVLWCVLLLCFLMLLCWLTCFKRCARLSRPRRHGPPTYPSRRSPGPQVAPSAAASAQSGKKGVKASTAAAAKKKKN